MSRGKQILNVFTGHLTLGTGVKMIRQLTNTAPFSMSGTTTGTKPCGDKTHKGVSHLDTQKESAYISTFVLPFAGVGQGQSSEVQSEEGLLLLSGSRTCGLRHELAVFRGGGQICSGYHPHQHQPQVMQHHIESSIIYTTERNRTWRHKWNEL